MRRYVSLLSLFTLLGCAAAPAWEKTGIGSETRDKDLAACRQEIRYTSDEARRRDARIAAARGEISSGRSSAYDSLRGDLDASTERRRESKALADCMRAKGYTNRS